MSYNVQSKKSCSQLCIKANNIVLGLQQSCTRGKDSVQQVFLFPEEEKENKKLFFYQPRKMACKIDVSVRFIASPKIFDY